ncbi:MAG: Asp-tRNA(Asn)/Glu-tRNA(Gln) amidotransferase subunit GatC [Deltaproteobacteria bacterium]|nr:Asp-tRNA(Asn)/Glu-tRNA(Gln) amidotransferase subunit GatC [Deltaproteobacteria bacterium]
MSRIDPKEVRQIAVLARLGLSEAEVTKLTHELDGILGYIAAVQGVNTTGVEPLTHAVGFACPLRPDEVQPSFDNDDALANAPRRHERFFEVPRIVPVSGSSDGGGS